jgi:calcineurin-like phosphoesterase family protein
MTFIPLTYKNFVKNKINNTIKVSYKDSNSDTFIYDNHLDSKSIINTVPYSELSIEEVGLNNNNNDELGNIDRFFRVSDNFIKNTQNRSSLKEFINEKKSLINGNNITNDNIKEFRFRNSYNRKN